MTPGSQSSLREANRARIVSAVQQRGSLTQVELAGATGLSPATVSNIVKELTGAGVLTTAPTSRSGRRAQQVALARNLGLVAGVHFGSRSLRVAVSDMGQQIVAEQRMPLPPEHRADAGLERAALLLTELVESVDAAWSEVQAVGVGVPAPVDPRTGRIVSVGVLRGWDGVSVTEVLGRRLGVPVHVDNDCNLGALAELRHGAARGCRHAVYLKASHGVGAGLVVEGRLVHGRSGAAGEFGHITVDEKGPICRCGNRGCLDAMIGAPALLRMLEPGHGHLTLPDVIARAQDGDPGCRRVISDAGRLLAIAAADTCNLLDPELVVVGGRLAEAGPILLDTFTAALAQRTLPSTVGPVPVVPAQLGTGAEVRGALALALDRAGIVGSMVVAG